MAYRRLQRLKGSTGIKYFGIVVSMVDHKRFKDTYRELEKLELEVDFIFKNAKYLKKQGNENDQAKATPSSFFSYVTNNGL